MLPELKVYKIDYSWIISNYLDRSMWNKKWNLFIFKDNIFTLNIKAINVYSEEIVFIIKHNKQEWNDRTVYYPLSGVMSINILKNAINGAIWGLLCDYDEKLIRRSHDYNSIANSRQEEDDYLEKVANQFLDDNGVSNKDIREVYVDNYVSNNSTIADKLSGFVSMCKYTYASEIMLVFTKIIGDTKRFNTIIDAQKNEYAVSKLIQEVDEYTKSLENDDNFDEYYELCESI